MSVCETESWHSWQASGKRLQCKYCGAFKTTTIYDTPSVRDASGAMKGSEQLAAEVMRRSRKEAQK